MVGWGARGYAHDSRRGPKTPIAITTRGFGAPCPRAYFLFPRAKSNAFKFQFLMRSCNQVGGLRYAGAAPDGDQMGN